MTSIMSEKTEIKKNYLLTLLIEKFYLKISNQYNYFLCLFVLMVYFSQQIQQTMDDNFSSRVKDVISYSKEEALRLGHKQIGTEHLLLGILRDGGGKAISILNSIEIDLNELRKKIELLNPAIIDASSLKLNEKKNT